MREPGFSNNPHLVLPLPLPASATPGGMSLTGIYPAPAGLQPTAIPPFLDFHNMLSSDLPFLYSQRTSTGQGGGEFPSLWGVQHHGLGKAFNFSSV